MSRPQHVFDRIFGTKERRVLVNELKEVQEECAVVGEPPLEIISSERCSIYKIPKFIREVDPRAYEPMVVSFGPYHYGKPHLRQMESMKQKGFCNFLAKHENLVVASIVDRVSLIFENLRDSYDKLDQKWKQNPIELLKVMIVDGCFMVDFLENNCPSYLHSKISEIQRDMMLLENQLPMELLQHLYSLANEGNPRVSQCESEKLFRSLICEKILSIRIEEAAIIGKKLHILDIYRESLLSPPMDNSYRIGVRETYDPSAPGWCQIIPPATVLLKLGIKFKKSDTKSLTEVYFDPKQAVLKLPYLVLSDDDIDTRLLNVMAFEKLHKYTGSEVMSYVWLMKNLIVDDNDVSLLICRGILSIPNSTGKAVVVELFNRLAKGTKTNNLDSHISKVFKQLNDHCNNPWTKWWVKLKDPRTQNPWVIISVVAASFGFLPQIIQTTYQVYEHFRPPH